MILMPGATIMDIIMTVTAVMNTAWNMIVPENDQEEKYEACSYRRFQNRQYQKGC